PAAVLAGVSQDRDAQNANTLVRLLSLAIFLPWYARSLLRLGASADDPLALPREATAVLVVYLLAVQSWFWPWYLIWVLPFAVIVPESGATTVALVMTATTSLLNAQPSISPPPFLDWLYGSRVILIYGVPLVAAAWRAGKLRGVDQWVSGARPCLQTAVDALMNFNFLIGYGARRGWRDVAAFQGRDARRRARPASAERPFARLPSRRRTALQSDPKAMLPGRSLSRPVAESPWPGHATPNPRHATHRAFGIPRKGISRATFVKAATIVAFILACGAQVGSGRAVERQPAVIGWQSAFDAAVRLYSAGDYQGTVDELTAVLAALPGERSVLQLRVAANVALGQYGQTIPDLTALLAQDPEDLDLRFERGVVYSRIQRSDRALADFRAVIAAQPTNPSGYEQAGLVQFERGDLELAGRSLERARNLDPESGQIAQELANVLASENRETAALALYDGAIHLDPSDARAYADRAALLRHLGSNEATIPDLKKVLVLSGDTQQQLWAAHLLAGLTGTGSRIAGESG
ncbi:MAG TPA: tetratricopeptide repeat protein, partial [Chloroflexota bacterium]|nr:tetratricopeptide repeat protein [Chloroflexota bacterium]